MAGDDRGGDDIKEWSIRKGNEMRTNKKIVKRVSSMQLRGYIEVDGKRTQKKQSRE